MNLTLVRWPKSAWFEAEVFGTMKDNRVLGWECDRGHGRMSGAKKVVLESGGGGEIGVAEDKYIARGGDFIGSNDGVS